MELQSILNLLSDGEFHSGSDLGRALGVSRTAVWKSLGHLSEFDLPVESVKGRGYRLNRPLDLLDQSIIQSKLDSAFSGDVSVDVLLKTESTNSYLLTKTPSSSRYECCLAELQTAGKGRRGRQWVSPFARNIYLSMAFDLEGGAEALSGLSLVVGISVAKVLKEKGVSEIELKWPNDVWLNGRKLAGILVELHGEATTSWRVVLGLGLNVTMTAEEAADIDQPWASLSEVLSVSRTELASSILEGLVTDLEVFKRKGFSGFLSDWVQYDGLIAKEVTVNDGALNGVARGVDRSGALLIETSDGLEAVNAGEVTIRCV